MSAHLEGRAPVWILVGIGVAIRLVLAFAFFGDTDVVLLERVESALDQDPLRVYEIVNPGVGEITFFSYSYPPLYFAAVAISSAITDVTGLPFHGTVQLWPILADVGIALAVHAYLGRRGASARVRLAGLALVMLGPCFVATSGFHGQIDSVAILPGVLALIAWEARGRRRAVESGLLIGVGTAVKTVPGVLLLPLLASARSLREGAKLLGAAVAVVLLVITPYLIADPDGVLALRHYQGLAGLGGLSLVTDPGLVEVWLRDRPGFELRDPTALGEFTAQNAGEITVLAVLAVALLLFRYRPAPIDAAVLLWLTVYALSPNFLMQYMVWGLPFFIMGGYLREVAIVQLVLVPAIMVYYLAPFEDPSLATAVYVPSLIALWAFWVVALVTVIRRVLARPPARAPAVQPSLVELEGAA